MDKNTIIGLLLMGLVLFGFTFYQNKQYQKQAAWQAHLDSIAAVEQYKADSAAAALPAPSTRIPSSPARMTQPASWSPWPTSGSKSSSRQRAPSPTRPA